MNVSSKIRDVYERISIKYITFIRADPFINFIYVLLKLDQWYVLVPSHMEMKAAELKTAYRIKRKLFLKFLF